VPVDPCPRELDPQELPPQDLDSRAQIHHLVVGFYREVVFDDLLEPVFSDVAEVDWAEHIPRLIDFWCRVLLGEPGYDGAILAAHAQIHAREPLRTEHCDRWYLLWVRTIDDRWAGPVAERAKEHASRIMAMLARRVLGTEWTPPAGAERAHQELPAPASPGGWPRTVPGLRFGYLHDS
jgi:hemoglobin